MIDVRALGRSFPGRTLPALDEVSFRIGPGEIVALAGRNGAGKTTLLDVLGTLLLPTAGAASVAGHDVVRETAQARARLGYAMAGPRALYTRLTGRHNLEFFAALHPAIEDPRARVEELIALLDLAPFVDLQVRRCSDGMLQKLVIARAMLGRPSVLLLDEPARALDVVAQARLARVLEALVAGGAVASVLYASHDLDARAARPVRTLVIARGRLIYDGVPRAGEITRLLEREETS